MTASGSADAQLVRAIGTRQLTLCIINVTIASSIFLMPATVAERLGAAAPIAYLVCATLMTLIALCFAAAGSRVSLTGGLYAYIDTAFGGFAGFLGGYLYSVTACLSVASVAAAFAGTAGVIWPVFAAGSARALLLAGLFAALAAVNVRGIKPGIRLVEVITAAKLMPLLFLVVAGVWSLNVDFLRMTMPTVSQVGQASIVLLFAFVGVEVALTPSGEISDPAKTVPRAILTALAVATSIYLAVQTVAQGTLGPELPLFKEAPLVETASRLFGTGAKVIFLIGMAVSIFGYIAGDMLGTPRVLFALARNGVLPSALVRVHPRYRTPAPAIVLYATAVAALAISSSFERLVVMANVSALLLYLMCVAASYQLQRRDVRMAGVPFNLPGGMLIQLLAAAGIVWLLWQATPEEWTIEAYVLAVAIIYYTAKRFLRSPYAVAASPAAPDR
ncbi:MAG TPA: APC family permease [Vicinamibacterales bacterium]|nr:APC family permease [Vicinamibacterales bacterium]